MKIKQIAALLAAVLVLISLAACSNRGGDESSSSGDGTDYSLVIYHGDTELTVPLTNLVKSYNAEKSKSVGVRLAGDNFLGEARDQKAGLYVVNAETGLSGWFEGGMFGDLASDTDLGGMTGDLPTALQMNQNGLGSYGIPLMISGYGYIFDYGMLEDLFGEDSAEALAEDLSVCSYTDFEGFVEAVTTYISAPSAATVTVEGHKYTFAEEKTGRAENLTGVFALNYESSRAEEILLSYALAAKYANSFEIMSMTADELSPEEDIYSAYVDALDMHSGHIAGTESSITRGDEFSGGDYDYTAAIDLFAHSYALFYPGSTLDAADFRKSVDGYDARLGILPMKLPLDDTRITAGGVSAEKLQSSIVIGSRYYLAINPNADAAQLSEAREFLQWVYSEEGGRTAFSTAFGGLAFNYSSESEAGTGNGSSDTGSGISSGTNSTSGSGTSTGSGSSQSAKTVSPTNGLTTSSNRAASSANGSSSPANGTSSPDGGETLSTGESNPETDGSGMSTGSGITSGNGSGTGDQLLMGTAGNYNISDPLTAAVARYYAEGR